MVYKKIENLAQRVLDKLEINSLPIDPSIIARRFNLSIIKGDLGKETSGILVIKKGKGTIGIQNNDPLVRQRFSVAHELGHYLLHRNESDLFIDNEFRILYRNHESTTGNDILEREANAFAAALLMPQSLLREDVENLDLSDENAIQKLAELYQVSQLAMTYRISNLRFF